MKWFKPKYTVCTQCSMLFEPTKGPFPDLCPTHRKPVMEKAERRQRVIAWATSNWEKLEAQMNADHANLNQLSQEYLKQALYGVKKCEHGMRLEWHCSYCADSGDDPRKPRRYTGLG